MRERKLLSLLALCAGLVNPTSGQTIVTSSWTCTTGDWAISGCWSALGAGDTQPDNSAAFLYDITLPSSLSPYTVTITSPSIILRTLHVEPDVVLRADSTNFAPGLLFNQGTIQVRNDDLFLDTDIVNDGVITFDSDAGAETIEVRSAGLTIGGGGSLLFPDVPEASTSVHRLNIPDLATTTNDVGHTISGGPGQIRGGNAAPTDFVNHGAVIASTPGMTLEFQDLVTGNVLRVINTGTLAATNGARLEFDDIAQILNTGLITCDAGSEIFLNSTVTTLSGTLDIDGLLNSNTNLTLHNATGAGTGTLSTDGNLTLSGATATEFGAVDHNAGNLTITAGAALTFNRSYTHSLTSESACDLQPGSAIVVTGGVAAAPNQFDDFASFEIAGRDVGDTPSGYTSNFNVPHLVIAPGAKLNLFDAVNNGNRGGAAGNAEALYVGTLEFLDGAGIVNLNGHHLYYSNLVGSPSQITDNGGGSGKGFTATWTCSSGAWSTTGCWSSLAPGALFPDNSDLTAYDVILPNNGAYTLAVGAGAPGVELTSLFIDTSVTLRLLSSDFNPGLLMNTGEVEIASDELRLSQDIINNGVIRFDLDTGTESITLERSAQVLGTGEVRFPDISSAAPQHAVIAPNGGTLTIGADQLWHGGPGRIGGGATSSTTVTIHGEVRADTPGKTLEFSDETSSNLLTVNNLGVIAALGGATLEFDDISAVANSGLITCDADSIIRLTTTPTSLGGTLVIDGALETDSALTLTGATGSGDGVLSTTAALTFAGASTVAFGIIDHNGAPLTVASGATLTFSRRYTHTLTSESDFSIQPGAAVMVTGGAGAGPTDYEAFASFEIAGRDRGDTPTGYTGNFDLPRLVIGPGAKLNLFDAVDNGNRGGAGGNDEALYVGAIEFLDGAGLINLNGHHLYYTTLIGSPSQIIDNGGGSGKSFAPQWTCATGVWSTTGCWSELAPGDLFPQRTDFTAYDVNLPAGAPYTVIVDAASGPVELTGLTIAPDATLLLQATNFTPGLLENNGAIEIASDDLFLTQDVINHGLIRFDADAGAEDIVITRSVDITGSGDIVFTDIASTSTTLHTISLPNLDTTTIAAGQTVRGGPGEFRGGSSFPTDLVIDGAVIADHAGKTIAFADTTTANVLRVTNNALIHATSGAHLEFDDIWGVVNQGTLSCDPGSTITFTTTTTDLSGNVIVNGAMVASNSLTFSGATGLGTGTLSVANSLTFTGGANVGFGAITTPLSLTVDDGSTLVIQGDFSHALTAESLFNFNNTGALRMTGGSGLDPCNPGTPVTLEVAGSDKGHTGSGFVNNFEIERLIIAPGANVMLVDLVNNGNRNGSAGAAEALYVDELIFEDAAGRIILNGLRLYYNSISGAIGQLDAGADCNGNGQLDACDLAMAISLDCNANGVPDECDIAGGASPDCNGNGIPDECEVGPDCNGNGIPDGCDIASGFSLDLNGNDTPDECENDCNLNGVPDDVDIALGDSEDCDSNGLPDECQGGYSTFTWIGPDGGNWDFPPNWSPLGPPRGDAILANPTATPITTVLQNADARTCTLELGSTGAGHALDIRASASLQADAITVNAGGQLNPTGGVIAGGPLVIDTGGLLAGSGDILNPVTNRAHLRTSAGQTLRLAGSTLVNESGALIEVVAGSTLAAESDTLIHDGDLRIQANATAAFTAPLSLTGGGALELQGGAVATPALSTDSISLITGFGTLNTTTLTNDGALVTIDNSQITGDVVNHGSITVQQGTLLILGSLTGSGSVIGDVARGSRGTPPLGLFILGDLAPSPEATLSLPSPDARLILGADFDVPFTSHLALDLADATLHMNALSAQSLEAMSVDLGPTEDGLSRAPGLFPVGTLRIGPTHTTVTIVDHHDNDTMGQSTCEAVYARTVIIESGATLDNATCPVYYQTLVNHGAVTTPANLVRIAPPCPGDADNSSTVDFTDLNIVLANWATTGPAGDVNGSGAVDFADLNDVLANWGTICD